MLPLIGLTLTAAAATLVAAEPAPPGITAAPNAARAPAGSPGPLTESFFPYSAIPYQVNPYQVERGPQSGFNQCNATTEGPDSQCQTAVFNSIEDFCFWGAPGLTPDQTIGEVEAAVVAYCSRSGHGARIFPEGTFSAIQFTRTPAYIQIVGIFNQQAVMLTANDTGGELDPHGADLAGNPLGGLYYSTAFGGGTGSSNGTYVQTQSWTNFLGSNTFCLKLCDPTYNAGDKNYCQNIYDLIGCEYNMPADYAMLRNTDGLFISCEGEMQDEVGTYVVNGATTTWQQPATMTASPPYVPRIPASSNCVTHKSTDLFPVASLGYQSNNTDPFHTKTATPSSSTGSGSASAGASATGSAKDGSAAGGSSTTKTSAGASATGTGTAAKSGASAATPFLASILLAAAGALFA